MKITSGDGSITQRSVVPGKVPASRGEPAAQNSAEAAHGAERGFAGMGTQRTISEALTIAQTARSLINKALSISSQLQNLARQAIATGNIDSAEVSRTVSEINTSMSQATGQPTFAVIPPAVQSGNQEPVRMDIPAVREELKGLARVASAIDAGGSIDEDAIGEVRNSLERKSAAVADILGAMEKSIQGIAGESAIGGRADAERATTVLAASIASNPALALSAQGNIRQENVLAHIS